MRRKGRLRSSFGGFIGNDNTRASLSKIEINSKHTLLNFESVPILQIHIRSARTGSTWRDGRNRGGIRPAVRCSPQFRSLPHAAACPHCDLSVHTQAVAEALPPSRHTPKRCVPKSLPKRDAGRNAQPRRDRRTPAY